MCALLYEYDDVITLCLLAGFLIWWFMYQDSLSPRVNIEYILYTKSRWVICRIGKARQDTSQFVKRRIAVVNCNMLVYEYI